MSKQGMIVVAIIGALILGGAGLVFFGPGIEGVDVGALAPNFRAVDLATSDSISLHKRYADKVTLVNIWATWGIPCRTEMPAMQQLYDAFAPQGFRIAAVSIDEGSPEDVLAFAKDLNLSFDILHDRSGRVQPLYQTTDVPESLLLNRRGI